MSEPRQSIDNLHDDITKVVLDAQKDGHYGKVVDVIDPSPGVWGGEPVEGLVTVVYQCPRKPSKWDGWVCGTEDHTHHALFGPTDERDRKEGEPVDHYSLYAD